MSLKPSICLINFVVFSYLRDLFLYSRHITGFTNMLNVDVGAFTCHRLSKYMVAGANIVSDSAI